MEDFILGNTDDLVDHGERPVVRFDGSGLDLDNALKEYRFTSEDNPSIGEGQLVMLRTCSAASYPYLKGRLIDEFGSYVAFLNTEEARSYDTRFNPGNVRLIELLMDGRPEHEVLIVPLSRRKNGHVPTQGVKLVTAAFLDRGGNAESAHLKLVTGFSHVNLSSRCLDLVTGGETASASECAVNLSLL